MMDPSYKIDRKTGDLHLRGVTLRTLQEISRILDMSGIRYDYNAYKKRVGCKVIYTEGYERAGVLTILNPRENVKVGVAVRGGVNV